MDEEDRKARLIATAPELLECLQDMIECLDPMMVEKHDAGLVAILGSGVHSGECKLCKARKVIAKARGGEIPSTDAIRRGNVTAQFILASQEVLS